MARSGQALGLFVAKSQTLLTNYLILQFPESIVSVCLIYNCEKPASYLLPLATCLLLLS
jgi:hypothetical protein